LLLKFSTPTERGIFMFTANDLRVLAEAELDDLLEDDDILPNINSALVEFADDYRKTETQTINAVAGEWVDRTSGILPLSVLPMRNWNICSALSCPMMAHRYDLGIPVCLW